MQQSDQIMLLLVQNVEQILTKPMNQLFSWNAVYQVSKEKMRIKILIPCIAIAGMNRLVKACLKIGMLMTQEYRIPPSPNLDKVTVNFNKLNNTDLSLPIHVTSFSPQGLKRTLEDSLVDHRAYKPYTLVRPPVLRLVLDPLAVKFLNNRL